MATLKKSVQVEIDLNGQEVAKLFCNLDTIEQANFFNEIAELVKFWDGTFDAQMHGVTTERHLQGGRKIMKTIGDYALNIL